MDVRKKDGCYQRIRVLATLLVVIGHICTLELPLKDGTTSFYSTANNLYITGVLEFVKKIIYSFHMPLFVFLSGAVFALTYKESTNFKSWTIKRIKKLMVPYFIVAIILYIPTRIVCGYYDTGINIINIICNDVILSKDINYLWYLVMLSEVTLIVILFRKYFMSSKVKTQLIVLVTCLILSTIRYVLPEMPFQINRTLEFLLWFYIGILVQKNRDKLCLGKNYSLILLFVWIISFFIHSAIEIKLTQTDLNYTMLLILKLIKMCIRLIMEGSACFCIFCFFEGSDEVKNKWISVLDSSSLTIYLLHPVIIMLSKQVIHMAIPAKYMSNILYLFLLAMVLLLSILIPCNVSKILRKKSQKI